MDEQILMVKANVGYYLGLVVPRINENDKMSLFQNSQFTASVCT